MNSGPRPQTLETWLRRMVRQDATRIRCIFDDDSEKVVKLEKTGQRPRVAAMMRTIESFHCSKLEALDEAGNVLDVWELEADPEGPGYLVKDGDSGDERLLKTFAHLIADAYKTGQKQLVEVVSIQSHSFAEERRHLASAVQTSDRIARRVRVAADEPKPQGDDFLEKMASIFGPMLAQRLAGAGNVVDEPPEEEPEEPQHANGAAKETPQ